MGAGSIVTTARKNVIGGVMQTRMLGVLALHQTLMVTPDFSFLSLALLRQIERQWQEEE